MDVSGTHPITRFKSVDENLLCGVCRKVPLTPVMGNCQHICCPPCINRCLHETGCCPVCRREMSTVELVAPGRIVQDLFRKLEISCDYAERGCGSWTRLSDWADHVNSCPKAPIRCPNEGCTSVVNRESIDEHQQQCERRLVQCELCAKPVQAMAMQAHASTMCPQTEIECTCGQKMRRGEKDQHLQNGCRDRALTLCPVLGCGRSIAQGDMELHLSSSLAKHLHLFTSALQERDTALNIVQQEMFKMKSTAESTAKKLMEAKTAIQSLTMANRELTWYGMGSWRHDPDGRTVWTIGNMNQRLKGANLKKQAGQITGAAYVPELIWSPQFYTHRDGYRFSIRIDLGNCPNVGLFVHLHEGEADNVLEWPFNLDYTVQLGNVVSHITQRDSYMHYTLQGRPPHDFSWGWANFSSIDSFKEAIVNDTLEVYIFFYGTSMPQAQYHTATVDKGKQPSASSIPYIHNALPGATY